MIYFERGGKEDVLSESVLKDALFAAFDKLGERKNVLVIPPDYTRLHSKAGLLTKFTYEYYKEKLKGILPALGTHKAMTAQEIAKMFEGVPSSLFIEHDWRNDVVKLGEVPASYINDISESMINFDYSVEINRNIVESDYDLVLSFGQVVPHEVAGMANHSKNVFVGTGGAEAINKSHYLAAVYGMERIMGRARNPVRDLFNYASDKFLKDIPVIYGLTVNSADYNGMLQTRGFYLGDCVETFYKSAALSFEINVNKLKSPIKKALVYLNEDEYKSMWLANKAIYRTRMAMADGGELIVMAPGVKHFGEDDVIDRLIRKYGYKGRKYVLEAVSENDDLSANLSAAAHLMHGSTEGRFTVKYASKHLSEKDVKSVSFEYADYDELASKYDPSKMKEGYNTIMGEEVYFISNPALGLWAYEGRF